MDAKADRRGERRRSGRRTVGGEVRLLLRTVIAVALLLLVVNVATRAYLLAHIAPRIQQLRDAADDLDRLHAGLVDEETGERGFLATGSTVFLAPYETALPVVATASRELADRLPSGHLTRDLVTMEQAHQRWTDEWAQRAAHVQPQRSLDAFLLQGKSLFDTYRQAELKLHGDIERDITSATNVEDDWLLGSGIAQACITVVVVALALLARRRIARRVTDPVAALATAVDRISQGNLDVQVTVPEGPEELVALGRDIDAMARALREQMTIAEQRERDATRHGERLATVLGAAREVAGSLSLRYVMSSVAAAAAGLGCERVRVWLLDEETDHVLSLSFDTAAGPTGPEQVTSMRIGAGVVGRAARYGHPVGPEPVASGGTAVGVPLIVGGRVVGALECLHSDADAISASELEVLEALAGHAAAAISAAQLHEITVEHSVTDALTRLPNRRAFQNEFDEEVHRALRYRRPLSFITVDLDYFKQLNDRYGHAYGDIALQRAGDALRSELRESDRIYRLGGEEIGIVCPETSVEQAAYLAERLRAAVEASAGPDSPRVTASFGVAELPSHAGDARSLLGAADRALYGAKAQGRNCVVVEQGTVPAHQ